MWDAGGMIIWGERAGNWWSRQAHKGFFVAVVCLMIRRSICVFVLPPINSPPDPRALEVNLGWVISDRSPTRNCKLLPSVKNVEVNRIESIKRRQRRHEVWKNSLPDFHKRSPSRCCSLTHLVQRCTMLAGNDWILGETRQHVVDGDKPWVISALESSRNVATCKNRIEKARKTTLSMAALSVAQPFPFGWANCCHGSGFRSFHLARQTQMAELRSRCRLRNVMNSFGKMAALVLSDLVVSHDDLTHWLSVSLKKGDSNDLESNERGAINNLNDLHLHARRPRSRSKRKHLGRMRKTEFPNETNIFATRRADRDKQALASHDDVGSWVNDLHTIDNGWVNENVRKW